MSLINDALKKAQRDRETDGATTSRPDIGPQAGPRPGNPAATRTFRWLRWSIAGALGISGLAAALLFLRVLIRPEPQPEPPLPSEVAVHIKLRQPQPQNNNAPDSPPLQGSAPLSTHKPDTPLHTDASNAGEDLPGTNETATATGQSASQAPTAGSAPAHEATPSPETTATAASTLPVSQSPKPTDSSPAPAPSQASTQSTSEPTAQPGPVSIATTDAASPTDSAESPDQPEVSGIPLAMPEQPVSVSASPPHTQPAASIVSTHGAANAGPPDTATDSPSAETTPAGDPAVLEFLRASHIAGVKIAGTRSRVLMNNQVFFVGSIVDPQTRLRIKTITNQEIKFVDESGLEYRKRFQR